ncbi:MAG: FtsX-like permease family protein, partial [bacterium]|nr:FtsX-like permease family protein [bacterium]
MLFRDASYAVRGLAKNPGLVLAVVVSISVGIAANTTVFSIVNAVMFGDLPVSEPDRLVSFAGGSSLSYVDYVAYRDLTNVFDGLSGHFPIVPVSLGGGEAERIWGQLVTGNYFEVLGLQPALGRAFRPEEADVPGRSAVVILSHSLWQRRFGGSPAILGETVIFNNQPFVVIGIMPPGFHGEDRALVSDFWAPATMVGNLLPDIAGEGLWSQRDMSWLSLSGRLKDGVTREQAQAAANVVKDRLDAEHNPDRAGKEPMKLSKAGGLFGEAQNAVLGLMAVLSVVVGLVLLIACANVANILLARATGRQKEISIRLAMGATRGRLIRQLLTESVILAACGAIVGLLLAWFAAQALSGIRLPISFPFQMDFRLDLRVLVFTALLTVLTGVLFGLMPALRATRLDLVSMLKDETGGFGSFRRFGLRQILVVSQVALCVLLLVSAGLFLRGL